MNWLELGKQIAKLGTPFLGALIAATPTKFVLEEISKVFDNVLGIPGTDTIEATDAMFEKVNTILTDAEGVKDKLVKIEEVLKGFTLTIAPQALEALIKKLL